MYRKPMVFNAICKLAMLLSTTVLIMGVVLVWILYPHTYDYKGVSLATMHCQCVPSPSLARMAEQKPDLSPGRLT